MPRILICGDRNWTNGEAILNFLRRFETYKSVVVIDGTARGADTLAYEAAKKLGFETERYMANWATHGKAAGPIRNRQMLVEGKPQLVVAFHSDIENSKGTKNMVQQAVKADIPVFVYSTSSRI